MERIAVVGSGSWGTALAFQAAKKNQVILWNRNAGTAEKIQKSRENTRYLPGVKLPERVTVTSAPDQLKECRTVVFAVPSRYFRQTAVGLAPFISADSHLVSAAKGFEYPSEKRMTEILCEEFSHPERISVISGPSHAEEVGRDMPTGITVAGYREDSAREVQHLLSTEHFRLYRHTDVKGVEVSGAVKNVIAIAAGALRGLGMGDNTMAALITRGLAEIRRLALKFGADEATFSGLGGVGDLIVTCTSPHSRNGRVGEALAAGKSIDEITEGWNMVAEGVETVRTLIRFEKEYQIEMPISHGVYEVIYEGKNPGNLIRELMVRPLKHEIHE